jgi:hypothetical protein
MKLKNVEKHVDFMLFKRNILVIAAVFDDLMIWTLNNNQILTLIFFYD